MPGRVALALELLLRTRMGANAMESAGPVLDRRVLEELNEIDEGIVADLVHAFSTDVPGRLSALSKGIAARSANDILREAQGLKGGACAVGAVRMAELCAHLENDARAGRFDNASARADRLQGAFDEVRDALTLAVAAMALRAADLTTRA